MNTAQANTAVLQSKPHFEVLDGLRGIAALAVVVFHFMEWVQPDFTKNFIAHGFLAVDFFFCLSGFVIAYAYDGRIRSMGVPQFFLSRFIRLHPLVIAGSVLGLLAFLFDPFGGDPGQYGAGMLALLFLCSALLIPFPVLADRGFNLFGLNAPSWSLFWEYAANIAYALVLHRLARRYLLLLALPAAAAICYVAWRSENLLGGWSGPTFWDGGARVAWSFLAGMLVYRYNWVIRNRLGFMGLSVLLLLAFILPFGKLNWLTEPLVVLLYFPLLIALGAGAVPGPRLKTVCNFSGRLSYPLYMTHYVALWMFGNYVTAYKPGAGQLTLVIAGGTLLLIGFAWLVMVWYDIPLRKYLERKRREGLLKREDRG